jgi:hypothetical protein
VIRRKSNEQDNLLPICRYFNGSGWESDGCEIYSIFKNFIECVCTHTIEFVITKDLFNNDNGNEDIENNNDDESDGNNNTSDSTSKFNYFSIILKSRIPLGIILLVLIGIHYYS